MLRLRRFNTRTLLSICTIAAIASWLVSLRVSDRERQLRSARDLRARGWDYSVHEQDLLDYLLNTYAVDRIFQQEVPPRTDFTTEEMTVLQHVVSLDLQNVNVSESDLIAVRHLKRLVVLDLEGTTITSPMAQQLCKMKQLKHLYVHGADIAPNDMAMVVRELPNTVIRGP